MLCAALELGARILVPEQAMPLLSAPLSGSVNTTTLSHVFDVHPTRFWSLRRGLRIQPAEFWGDVSNHEGIRRPGPVAPRSAERRRVLCIGDSCTYGLGVRHDEAWPALLGSAGFDAINAGVPGYSSFQMELHLRELLPRYEPDAVVLTVGNNDCAPWPTQQRGAIVFLSDEDRAMHMSIRGIATVSRFAACIMALGAPSPVEQAGRFDHDDYGASPPRVSVEKFMSTVDRMKSASPAPMLVAWPRRTDFEPHYPDALSARAAPYRSALRARYGGEPRFVDLAAVFRRSGRPSGDLFIDTIHVTPLGNRIAAEAIAAALAR